jgi:glycosyltransferase involved in cell wall biosynthesis
MAMVLQQHAVRQNDKRMKILHTVEFYDPSVGGMQEVVKQVSERLVKRGHEVTVATTKLPGRTTLVLNGVAIKEFSVTGNFARGISGEVEAYSTFLVNSRFDVITNFAAQQWATDAMITMLDRIQAKKVFVPTGFSGLYDKKYRRYFEQMAAWMKQYDMNVFLSETYRDAAFARDQGLKNRIVIPNGASEDEFLSQDDLDIRSRLGIPRDHFLILHVGSHTGLKGHREAFRMFSKAAIGNATLLIVANDFGQGCGRECAIRSLLFNKLTAGRPDGKRVIVTALARPETIAAYKTADLFLFPSNVECSPLVLFECMASKTPFLSTAVGNAVEIVEWSRAGMILPTETKRDGQGKAAIAGSARMIEELHGNPGLRKTMQTLGFRAWQERFTWESVASDYEHLYRGLLGGTA